MAMSVRQPIWLRTAVREPGARAFAILFAIESLSRASITSVIPIEAYDLLKDEQAVSLLYTLVGIASLGATLMIPVLVQKIARRRVYTLGALSLIGACAAFAAYTIEGQAAGMFLRVFGASSLAVTLNLYIMDFIRKQDVVRSESLRMAAATLSWSLGPGFGVFLYTRYGVAAPYLWSAACAAVLLATFWFFRLSDNKAIVPGRIKPANPVANIGSFIRQPRLRLAWFIAFTRSCYWNTLYIYAPILMVATGEGKLAGGLVVSAANMLLFSALAWGRLGARLGVRRVVPLCFLGIFAAAMAAGLFGVASPWFAAFFLLSGALFAVGLDAVGNAPFLRAVHSYERAQMTSVYRTNLELSELLPPAVYAVILGFFGLDAVFIALALFTLLAALVSWRYLPDSM
ncbi:MFS transporter [Afifella sp. IM 167]|uniref:MFS transporter n=1 Tax=Afifella sp. IM 167 TaxID=2033586 RepID=UPI001CCF71CE|nr:MFS transporter [Afifella sp. IM 167]MBZ8134990.1 MFS transporter [Afifella sp. IM 167]